MRGGRCVSAAALKAREGWWNGKKSEPRKKDPSVHEAVELIHKTGRNPLEKEVQEALPGLELVKTGTIANPRRSKVKRGSH